MHKITETGPAFCVCAGGIAACLLCRTDLSVSLIIFAFAIIYLLICCLAVRGRGCDSAAVRAVLGVYSVVSAGASVMLCASLVTDSSVMDRTFYPLILLLTGLFALCFGFSKRSAVVSVSFIVGVLSMLALLILMFLCVLRTDFGAVSLVKPDTRLSAVLIAFSVFDTVLVIPLMRGKPAMLFCGGAAAHLYGIGMTLLAVTVLTEDIFNSVNMPWLVLWRSTFITSFLNSFEILGVCAFFILTAVKAGIAVKHALDFFGKKYASVILIFIFAFASVFTVYSKTIYAAVFLSALTGITVPLICFCRKKRNSPDL